MTTAANTKKETRGVLGGAYRGKGASLKALLTHSVIVDGDSVELAVVCRGVKLENIADMHSDPAGNARADLLEVPREVRSLNETNETELKMGDVECIHCGHEHDSFGLLPLCPKCTRAHARALPKGPTASQDRALARLAAGVKVRADMIESLGKLGLVRPIRETRMSGAGGMPSQWTVVTGGTLTATGRARLAELATA